MKTRLTISTLPILPSEKFMYKEAKRSSNQAETAKDKAPFGRKPSKTRSSKRHESHRKVVTAEDSPAADSDKDTYFRSTFKNKRSSKKKSIGQGTGRRKRPRRK